PNNLIVVRYTRPGILRKRKHLRNRPPTSARWPLALRRAGRLVHSRARPHGAIFLSDSHGPDLPFSFFLAPARRAPASAAFGLGPVRPGLPALLPGRRAVRRRGGGGLGGAAGRPAAAAGRRRHGPGPAVACARNGVRLRRRDRRGFSVYRRPRLDRRRHAGRPGAGGPDRAVAGRPRGHVDRPAVAGDLARRAVPAAG